MRSKSQYNLLLQEKADLGNEARGVYAVAEGEGRDLTDGEKRRDDEITGRLDMVNQELIREDRERLEKAAGVIDAHEVTGSGLGGDYPQVRAAAPHLAGPGPRRYADLFGKPQASPWASGEDFFAALHSGLANPMLIQATATTGVPAEGGFLVPEQLVAEMLDASLEDEIVRPRAHVTPMTSETKRVAGFDASTASGSTLFGAYTGQWVPEGGIITAQTPKLRQIVLNARKLALLTQAANELIASGMSYSESLEMAMVKAVGWFLDDAFLNGTGAGMPLGIMNDPALITQPKEVGQTAATIEYTNLLKMFARCHPACRQKAVWVANNTAIPQLGSLSVLVGAGGSHIPVMTREGGQFMILTRPVIFTEKLAALGAKGDIVLADFSQYYVGLAQAMSLAKSAHAGFETDTTYYRGILRGDGQGKWSAAYTPKTGDTMSPFVTLAART